MLRQDDYQRAQLVTVGWLHGRPYGGYQAAIAIMSVISNRVRAGWGTWLEAIDRIPAFSSELEMPTGTPTIWAPEFVRLLHEVEAIFDGSQDYSKGAVYWADLTRVTNPWFKEKILAYPEQHPRVLDMNSLSFFR